jgi:hypothetical protein
MKAPLKDLRLFLESNSEISGQDKFKIMELARGAVDTALKNIDKKEILVWPKSSSEKRVY